jgi:hypothetical protein
MGFQCKPLTTDEPPAKLTDKSSADRGSRTGTWSGEA